MRINNSHKHTHSSSILFTEVREDNEGSGRMTELDLSYYTDILDNGKFELFGILGRGRFENDFSVFEGKNKGYISSNITKYALQANIGYQRKFFEIAYSIKTNIC